jgi:hypothetical protein
MSTTTLEQLESAAEEFRAALARAAEAFTATPDREHALDKMVADEQLRQAEAAIETERQRLEVERRREMEAELEGLHAQLSREAIIESVRDLAEREAEMRTGILACVAERESRMLALDALDSRRENLENDLHGKAHRPLEIGATMGTFTTEFVDEKLSEAAWQYIPENRDGATRARLHYNLIQTARIPR